MSMRILRFGNQRGVGAIVEKKYFFGMGVRTWTLVPSNIDMRFDKWVCRENGFSWYRGCTDVGDFYDAQYLTKGEDA